jgi:hypothetical protein
MCPAGWQEQTGPFLIHLPRYFYVGGRAPVSDDCDGVGLAFRRKWVRPNHVKQYCSPPQSLQGIGGFVRVKKSGSFDLGVMVLYAPPCSDQTKKQCTAALFSWALHTLPARCLPCVLIDANAHLGSVTEDSDDGFPIAGGHGAQRESWSRHLLRSFAVQAGLSVLNNQG